MNSKAESPVLTNGSVRDGPRSDAGQPSGAAFPFIPAALLLKWLDLAWQPTTLLLHIAAASDDPLRLLQPDEAGITVALLHTKFAAIKASGVRLSLHWIASFVFRATLDIQSSSLSHVRVVLVTLTLGLRFSSSKIGGIFASLTPVIGFPRS
ncbi:hypothetical protein HPB52_019345 [Rhipicephalus sanguineus]|uniref:Uncharacterized protein n=1 Tax=Rhipicephalus sanguineus TaxID=34632 RepID=A0A9D4PG77_RHISA|nr:hypothetical protein HPB52_019345 [Rhipicephalus sanguineus]